jgi:hypothetical protein
MERTETIRRENAELKNELQLVRKMSLSPESKVVENEEVAKLKEQMEKLRGLLASYFWGLG